MNLDPQTLEEQLALQQALLHGARYEVEMTVTVIALDEAEIRRDALAALAESRFESEESRARVTARAESDTAEALGILLRSDRLLNTQGAVSRGASHRIQLKDS